MKPISTVSILGAGSWGTAVAVHLAMYIPKVLLWSHDAQKIADMKQYRVNKQYLPDICFPESVIPIADLNKAVARADYTIIAVPSHAFKSVLQQITVPLKSISWLTKGLDPDTNALLSDIATSFFSNEFPLAVISGPSFATEVAQGMPTALTIASKDAALQRDLHRVFHHQHLRAYLSDDIIGVQICGAVKNVLAIACGVSDGMGFGANAKAALITRGLAEMRRLGIQLGAREDTFMGLAGVGDLVLTCTDNQSRNRRFGLKLGSGISASEAETSIGQVVEGKHNAAQVCTLARKYQIDMPICEQVFQLIHEKITLDQAMENLFKRPPKDESGAHCH